MVASCRMCVVVAGAAWLSVGFGVAGALAVGEPPRVVTREVPPEAPKPAPTRVSPVVVEAKTPAELRKQTYEFVQTFGATTIKLEQMARWVVPICVSVQGLPDQAAAEVKGRVEEVAQALKVKLDKPGCDANIQIFFTDQPQAFMDRIAAQHERMLGYYHHKDRDKLKVVSHPIQSWYVTATGGTGGNTNGMRFMNITSFANTTQRANTPASAMAPVAVPPDVTTAPHGLVVDDEVNDRMPTGCGDNPHFTSCLTSELEHVLVVVDTGKVQDYGAGPVADYVTMLAMAQPKTLDGCNVLPSVIDLFSMNCGDNGKDGLTRADVAYLTSLYKMDLELKKTAQLSDIAGRMADMLIRANKAERLTIQAGAAER